MKHHIRSAAAAFSLIVFFAQNCDSVKPNEGPGEVEMITRVTLTLTSSVGHTVTATADDPEGDGVDIAIDTLYLRAGATYTGRISFEDTIHGIDVTREVRAEERGHQVFYTFGDGLESLVALAAADEDDNGLPVGLDFVAQVTARNASSGTLRVTLSHFDAGSKDGINPSTEADIDLLFPVIIEQESPF